MFDTGWNVVLLVGVLLLLNLITEKLIGEPKKKSKVYWVEKRLK